ncbi:hypothetical protein G6F57_011390 [Rhizopus arrhizus]|uniref:Ornithine cyclodeaminase n=1 Tax=Rhizopus oryzae TaxID=64495 RepID=A0A9P6X5M9_RHIOR|nr:hypothetical protein G6F23_008257 [Rhizopus arrhizus]KAG1409019.1 hypothetical protein G6F58_009413 [Rhizopus delemar]KAG0761366.1 hypothetical protein G6F24_007623 [Rhizopus arrhizus]KAG0778508.1 hypothetical protein G6F22_011191 [Rhizopus arrhizus]KAG0782509.1 hypothetical protein G6F21_011075 [Rhizopus arrhizus]
MEDTFQKFTASQSNGEQALKIESPHRIGVKMDSHQALFMPSRLGETTSIKIVSVPTKDGKGGLPATILVLNQYTGSVEAVLNAADLTAVRTAAGSGLATRYYADPNAKNLVVFGAGAQGRSHVDMMIAARPTIKRVAIWNRGDERRNRLINELRDSYPDREIVSANENLENEVRQADIICTCTNATSPVLFGKWLKLGVHLNCVGSYTKDMHEVDDETIKKAELIIVDSIDACSLEAGELIKSSQPQDWLEIGQVAISKINVEQSRNKITLFKSVGISVQDSAISGLMVKLAKENKEGTIVPF